MTRWGRVARGTIAAAVSVFMAAFAHSLAGGELPGIAGIALCLTFSVIVCTAFTGRRMPRARLAASILAGQAMYHWLFGSLGSLDSAAAPATLGHVHNAPVDFGTLTTQTHAHGDMLLAHIVAAVATFAVIAFGERSMTFVVQAARKLVLSLIPRLADVPTPSMPRLPRVHHGHSAVPLRRRVDHSGLRHRGPPLVLAA